MQLLHAACAREFHAAAAAARKKLKTFLRNQKQLPGRLPSLEVPVRLLCVLQRVQMLDAQFQFAGRDRVQHVRGTLLKLFVARDVVHQRGPGDEQGTLLRQLAEIEGWNRAARSSEQHKITTRAQNIQVLIESSFTDAVVDDVHTFAAGQAL